jgi:hypothetical protein
MKEFFEKILSCLPYFILVVLAGLLLIIFYQNGLSFEHLIDVLEVLIWPTVILVAMLFFRKVLTYLFFSMEEFNFFGTKGGLKDIRKIIEEKVESRIKEEKEATERLSTISKFELELNNAKKSIDDAGKKAEENLNLATTIFKQYKELSDMHTETEKELEKLRFEKEERNMRMIKAREKIKNRIKTTYSDTEYSTGGSLKSNKQD